MFVNILDSRRVPVFGQAYEQDRRYSFPIFQLARDAARVRLQSFQYLSFLRFSPTQGLSDDPCATGRDGGESLLLWREHSCSCCFLLPAQRFLKSCGPPSPAPQETASSTSKFTSPQKPTTTIPSQST